MNSILWLRFINFKTHYKMFLLMLLLAILFSFAFSGGTEASIVNIPIVDNDQSHLAASLIDAIDKKNIYKVQLMDKNEMEKGISEGSYELGLVLRKNMEKVELITSRESVFAFSFKGFLEGQLNLLAQQEITTEATYLAINKNETIKEEFSRKRVSEITKEKWSEPDVVGFSVEYLGSEDRIPYDQNLQALFGFTLFFSMYLTLFSLSEILEDRRKGIWNRLIISPLSKVQLYMGNFVYSYLISIAQVMIMIIFGKYVIGVNWGDKIFLILIIILCFIFCVLSLGMLLVGIAKSSQQMQSLIPLVSVASAMLGGAYWPLEIISSPILLFLAKISPIYYGLEAIKKVVLYGQGFEGMMINIVILLIAGLFSAILGIYLVEKNE